ncbi:MAG: hypothetical protein IJJ82_05865 [Clostridia bacterium]|nr:hypothetical protein [Clostridia bacterium]
MLSYIASNSIANLIENICVETNIMILSREIEELDFLKYIKQTKVNFYLIKFLIIDLNQIKDTEEEFINSIKVFQELYLNTKIIVIAKGFDNQNYILTSLYEIGIYNLINSSDENQIQLEIRKCLLQGGLEKKDAKRFIRQVEIKETKANKFKQKFLDVKEKIIKHKNKENKVEKVETHENPNSVYFFAIFMEAVTRLVKLICYFAVFILTSIGLTILFNAELRNIIFQTFNK